MKCFIKSIRWVQLTATWFKRIPHRFIRIKCYLFKRKIKISEDKVSFLMNKAAFFYLRTMRKWEKTTSNFLLFTLLTFTIFVIETQSSRKVIINYCCNISGIMSNNNAGGRNVLRASVTFTFIYWWFFRTWGTRIFIMVSSNGC